MLLIWASLALLAAQPAAVPAPPAAPIAANAVASAPQDGPPSLDGLQQIYEQSCANREYGAFDDLCDQLSQQIRQARSQAARDAPEAARKRRSTPHKPIPAPPPGAKPPVP